VPCCFYKVCYHSAASWRFQLKEIYNIIIELNALAIQQKPKACLIGDQETNDRGLTHRNLRVPYPFETALKGCHGSYRPVMGKLF